MLFDIKSITANSLAKIEYGSLEVVPDCVISPLRITSIKKMLEQTELKGNVVIPYWTNNHWSTYDMLMYILHKTGPAEVGFFTWGLGKQAVEIIQKAIQGGAITECYAVFDKTLKQRKSNIHAKALMVIPNVGYTDVHGKAFVVKNEHYSITAITTSNMTKNRRLEFGVIFTQEDVSNTFFSLIKDITNG